MTEPELPAAEQEIREPRKRSAWGRRGCLGCLSLIGVLILLCVVAPFLLSRLQIFGQSAEEAYSGSPDPFASAVVQDVFAGRQISGVKVYVMPVKGRTANQAFIILDASQGYQGLDPSSADDTVFIQVLSDLAARNHREELGLERVTVEYRDESGQRGMAFTTPMESIDALVEGRLSRDAFLGQVYFDITDSLGVFGLDVGDLLQELRNQ